MCSLLVADRGYAGVGGLCTQVTSFSDEPTLRARLGDLLGAGIEGIAFVGVPRTMSDEEGRRTADRCAVSLSGPGRQPRGADPDSRRRGRRVRVQMRPGHLPDATLEAIIRVPRTSPQQPPAGDLLSFGFVPKLESRVGLVNWLIRIGQRGCEQNSPSDSRQ